MCVGGGGGAGIIHSHFICVLFVCQALCLIASSPGSIFILKLAGQKIGPGSDDKIFVRMR